MIKKAGRAGVVKLDFLMDDTHRTGVGCTFGWSGFGTVVASLAVHTCGVAPVYTRVFFDRLYRPNWGRV